MHAPRHALRAVLVLAALAGGGACKKAGPAPAPAATVETPPAPASADVPVAAEVTPPAVGEPARAEKSEELRFIEANAALLCFEKENKRKLKDGDRVVILKEHGFGGKAGAEAFTTLSIRGEKDADWGKRTGARIQEEMQLQCAAALKGKD